MTWHSYTGFYTDQTRAKGIYCSDLWFVLVVKVPPAYLECSVRSFWWHEVRSCYKKLQLHFPNWVWTSAVIYQISVWTSAVLDFYGDKLRHTFVTPWIGVNTFSVWMDDVSEPPFREVKTWEVATLREVTLSRFISLFYICPPAKISPNI